MLQNFIFLMHKTWKEKFPRELNKAKYSQVPKEKEVNDLNLKQVLATRREEVRPLLKMTPPLENG